MKFLLDTNAVITLLQGKAGFIARLKHHHPSDFGMPSVVAHELYYGAYRSQRRDENLARLRLCLLKLLRSVRRMPALPGLCGRD